MPMAPRTFVASPIRICRIKDLDRDGVDAEVIYGILGASSRLNDHDAANEMLRIYNDWLKGLLQHYPDRHIGLAACPTATIDAAVKEIYRVAKLGLRGLELSCSWTWSRCGTDVGAAVEGGETTCSFPCISIPSRRFRPTPSKSTAAGSGARCSSPSYRASR